MRSQPITSFSENAEIDSGPLRVTKDEVVAQLNAAGLPSKWLLCDALDKCQALPSLRARLRSEVGDLPAIAECDGRFLDGLLPPALHDWPVWYVRLPESWCHDVPRLVMEPRFVNHILRDDLDPWRVPQWLSLISRYTETGWPADARRLDIDGADAQRMLERAERTGATLVLFECSGSVTVTGYPADEELQWDLQAGDGCSSRNPLFELDLAEVQALMRAVEDGCPLARPGETLRLAVIPVDRPAAPAWSTDYLEAISPAFRTTWQRDGLIGEPRSVVDWCPPDIELGAGHCLRIDVPPEFHRDMLEWGARCRVVRSLPRGGAPMLLAVTIQSGPHLYIAKLRLDDSRMYRAVREFVDCGVCVVVAVNTRNGRPHPIRIAWPRHLHGLYVASVPELQAGVDDVLTLSDSDLVRHLDATTPDVKRVQWCDVRVVR